MGVLLLVAGVMAAAAAAVPAAMIATGLLSTLRTPDRLGAKSGGLLALAAYTGLAEVNMEPLAGHLADRAFDVLLAVLALGLFVALWRQDRPALHEVLGHPVGWLLLLFVAGFTFFPFSESPFDTILRTPVAFALVGSAAILCRRHGFVPTLAAVAVGATCLILACLAWEVVGPGTPPLVYNGAILDSGFAGLARHQGLTASPNQFGRVAATSLVVGALLIRHRPWARFGWAVQAIALAGLFYAQSRTSIIMGVLFVLLAHALGGRSRTVVAAVVLVGTLTVWMAASGIVGVDTVTRKDAGTQEITTATGRTALWHVTFGLIAERPLSGVGAFATSAALAPAVEDGRIAFKADDAHNVFLNVVLSQGLLGLGLLVAFAVSVLRNAAGRVGAAGAGILIATIGGQGMMETVIWKPNATLIMLAVGAAALTPWRPAQLSAEASTRPRPGPAAATRSSWPTMNLQASPQISSSPR